MYTSNYGLVKKINAAGLEPVAISAGVPRWFRGRREMRLAPEKSWLKLPKSEYDARFLARLAGLDPRQVYDDLGEGAVLLCWECPGGPACHRRLVAEWFEKDMSVVVPEFGLMFCPPYDEMPWPD